MIELVEKNLQIEIDVDIFLDLENFYEIWTNYFFRKRHSN